MEAVLGRANIVHRFTWNATDVVGTVLQTLDMPNDLLALASIYEKLCRFNYFRADIELDIRLSSNQFMSGQLMFYHQPDCSPTTLASLTGNIYSASTSNPVLILANTATSIKLIIPYQHQGDFLRLPQAATSLGAFFSGSFVVLAPLTTMASDSASTTDVTVWARFLNVKVAGPMTKVWDPLPAPAGIQGYKFRKYTIGTGSERDQPRPQSEGDSRSSQRIVTGSTRTSPFKAIINKIPIIGGLAQTAEAIGGLLGLSRPTSTVASEHSLIDNTRGDFQGSGLDNSEPLSLTPTPHVSDDQAVFGRDDPACVSFKALAQKPSLYNMFSVPNTAIAGTVIAQFPVAPYAKKVGTTVYPTWFNLAANNFRYWRGSNKYLVAISCASFTTARLRIMWTPEQDASISESAGGDVYNEIVEVKGDTVVKFSIPWLKESPFLLTPRGLETTGHQNGWITIALVNNPVVYNTIDATTFMSLSVWHGAGPDIQFSRPCASSALFGMARPLPKKQAGSAAEAELIRPQGDICDLFGSAFPPIIDATSTTLQRYTTSEEEYSIRAVAHRYQYFSPWNLNGSNTPARPYPVGYSDGVPLYLPVWSLFRFFRGSVRVRWNRLFNATNNEDTSILKIRLNSSTDDTPDNDESDTYHYKWKIFTQANPTAYIEIPYNSTHRYYKIPDAADERGVTIDCFSVLNTGTNQNFQAQVAAGDDISFGCLRPLQAVTISAQTKSSSTKAKSTTKG